MSTRATYRISDGDNLQYFYIHYDGYPEGAIRYFQQMISNLNELMGEDTAGLYRAGKAIIAFGMLPFAEFTKDHELHGDTEYRYNLYYDKKDNTWFLKAYEYNWDLAFTNFQQLYQGDLIGFIDKYKG